MGRYYEKLREDIRFIEGLTACMNCGVCTAVCPAAEFYNYDPRQIMDLVQSEDDSKIEQLLSSEDIWYCGECMSCRPRCPRGNTPGYVIQALRRLSQQTGLFVESEKGRQQLALKRTIGHNILELGFCIHPTRVLPNLHPEQGPVWQWVSSNVKEVFTRFDEGYDSDMPGAMRKINEASLNEIRSIFDVTGATDFFEMIEDFSGEKASQMGMSQECDGKQRANDEYVDMIYTTNNGKHSL